jgi:regulator of cell morphogenesis and NO signaling
LPFNVFLVYQKQEHLSKEEEAVFPLILAKNWEHPSLLEELEAEHEQAGDLLHKMIEVTNHFQLPEDGCTTYALTFRKLQALISDTYVHVHTENNVLFPKIKKEVQNVSN